MIFRLSCRQLRRNIFGSIIVWIQLLLTVLIITEIGTKLINANFAINSVYTTRFDELSYYSEKGSFSSILDAQESGASQEEIQRLMEQMSKTTPDQPVMRICHASVNDSSLAEPVSGYYPSIAVVDEELAVRTSLPFRRASGLIRSGMNRRGIRRLSAPRCWITSRSGRLTPFPPAVPAS